MNGPSTGNCQKSVEIRGPDTRSRTDPNRRTSTTFRLGVSKSPGKLRNPGRRRTRVDRRETNQTRGCQPPSTRSHAMDWRGSPCTGTYS